MLRASMSLNMSPRSRICKEDTCPEPAPMLTRPYSRASEAGEAGRAAQREGVRRGDHSWAVKPVRPKATAVLAALLGPLPIMWSVGTGAVLMKRVAAPMVGRHVTSFVIEMLVYPAVFFPLEGARVGEASGRRDRRANRSATDRALRTQG